MKELLSFFKKTAINAIDGSLDDLIYLINVFEYEIHHTNKLNGLKDKIRLKFEVYDVIKNVKNEDFKKLIDLVK